MKTRIPVYRQNRWRTTAVVALICFSTTVIGPFPASALAPEPTFGIRRQAQSQETILSRALSVSLTRFLTQTPAARQTPEALRQEIARMIEPVLDPDGAHPIAVVNEGLSERGTCRFSFTQGTTVFHLRCNLADRSVLVDTTPLLAVTAGESSEAPLPVNDRRIIFGPVPDETVVSPLSDPVFRDTVRTVRIVFPAGAAYTLGGFSMLYPHMIASLFATFPHLQHIDVISPPYRGLAPSYDGRVQEHAVATVRADPRQYRREVEGIFARSPTDLIIVGELCWAPEEDILGLESVLNRVAPDAVCLVNIQDLYVSGDALAFLPLYKRPVYIDRRGDGYAVDVSIAPFDRVPEQIEKVFDSLGLEPLIPEDPTITADPALNAVVSAKLRDLGVGISGRPAILLNIHGNHYAELIAAEKWVELTQELVRAGYEVVFRSGDNEWYGGAMDRSYTDRIYAQLPLQTQRFAHVYEPDTLAETIALIGNGTIDSVVSIQTGIGHIAAEMRKPTFIIRGGDLFWLPRERNGLTILGGNPLGIAHAVETINEKRAALGLSDPAAGESAEDASSRPVPRLSSAERAGRIHEAIGFLYQHGVDFVDEEAMITRAFDALDIQPGQRLLEVGPGAAPVGLVAALLGADVVMVDPSIIPRTLLPYLLGQEQVQQMIAVHGGSVSFIGQEIQEAFPDGVVPFDRIISLDAVQMPAGAVADILDHIARYAAADCRIWYGPLDGETQLWQAIYKDLLKAFERYGARNNGYTPVSSFTYPYQEYAAVLTFSPRENVATKRRVETAGGESTEAAIVAGPVRLSGLRMGRDGMEWQVYGDISDGKLREDIAAVLKSALLQWHGKTGYRSIGPNCKILARVIGRAGAAVWEGDSPGIYVLESDDLHRGKDAQPGWQPPLGSVINHAVTYFVVDGYHIALDATTPVYVKPGEQLDARIFVFKAPPGNEARDRMSDALAHYYGGEWRITDEYAEHSFTGSYPPNWSRSFVSNIDWVYVWLQDPQYPQRSDAVERYNVMRELEYQFAPAFEMLFGANGTIPTEEMLVTPAWQPVRDLLRAVARDAEYQDAFLSVARAYSEDRTVSAAAVAFIDTHVWSAADPAAGESSELAAIPADDIARIKHRGCSDEMIADVLHYCARTGIDSEVFRAAGMVDWGIPYLYALSQVPGYDPAQLSAEMLAEAITRDELCNQSRSPRETEEVTPALFTSYLQDPRMVRVRFYLAHGDYRRVRAELGVRPNMTDEELSRLQRVVLEALIENHWQGIYNQTTVLTARAYRDLVGAALFDMTIKGTPFVAGQLTDVLDRVGIPIRGFDARIRASALDHLLSALPVPYRIYGPEGYVVPKVFDMVQDIYRGSCEIDHLHAQHVCRHIFGALIYGTAGGEATRSDHFGTGDEQAQGEYVLYQIAMGNGMAVIAGPDQEQFSFTLKAPEGSAAVEIPEYVRKRRIPTRGHSVAALLRQLTGWQVNERRAQNNLGTIFSALPGLTVEMRERAVRLLAEELRTLRDACGLEPAYFDAVYGSLLDGDVLQQSLADAILMRGTALKPVLQSLLAGRQVANVRRPVIPAGMAADIPHPWLRDGYTLIDYLNDGVRHRHDGTIDQISLGDIHVTSTGGLLYREGDGSLSPAQMFAEIRELLNVAQNRDRIIALFEEARASYRDPTVENINFFRELGYLFMGRGPYLAPCDSQAIRIADELEEGMTADATTSQRARRVNSVGGESAETAGRFTGEKAEAVALAARLRVPLRASDEAMAQRYLAELGVPEGGALDGSRAIGNEGDQGYYVDRTNVSVMGRRLSGRDVFLSRVMRMSHFFTRRAERLGKPIRYVIKLGIGGQHTPFAGIAAPFQVLDPQTGRVVGEYELGADYEQALAVTLEELGADWDQIAVIPSSKSGATDETMLLFSTLLKILLSKVASMNGLDGEAFAATTLQMMHSINVVDGEERRPEDLFKGFTLTELRDMLRARQVKGLDPDDARASEQVRGIFGVVVGNMIFETTDRPQASRLSAFMRNSGLDRELRGDAPLFIPMFDNVGGRWSCDLHMMTFLAYYGLDAARYWETRYEGIQGVRAGTHPGNRLGDEILDNGITDIALVVPDEFFWFGKAIEQNFNESIWQPGFAKLVAIPQSQWAAQEGLYRGQPASMVVNMSPLDITDGAGYRVFPLQSPDLGVLTKQELAETFARLYTTFYGATETVGDRLIVRALHRAELTAADVDMSDLDNPAARIVRDNLYLLQPYVELGKKIIEKKFVELQKKESVQPGAIAAEMDRVRELAEKGRGESNVPGLVMPADGIQDVAQLAAVIRQAAEAAQREGRTFVPFLYLEGEKFVSLRSALIGMGIPWVMQGTGDQHISYQQVLAQPQKYLPLVISFMPKDPLPGSPAIGFDKAYLHMVSPHLVRDAFAEASYRALTMLRGEQGGEGVFLRLRDDAATRTMLAQAAEQAWEGIATAAAPNEQPPSALPFEDLPVALPVDMNVEGHEAAERTA